MSAHHLTAATSHPLFSRRAGFGRFLHPWGSVAHGVPGPGPARLRVKFGSDASGPLRPRRPSHAKYAHSTLIMWACKTRTLPI